MRHLTLICLLTAFLSILSVECLLHPPSAAASTSMPECQEVPSLKLNETALIDGPSAAEAALFTLEIPTPGLLAVELNVPGFETIGTWIDLSPDPCSFVAGKAWAVEESLNRQLWAISAPGRFLVRVSTVAPQLALSRFKMTTRLISDPSAPLTGRVTFTKDSGVGECEDEIVPCSKASWCAGGEPSDDLALCARDFGLGRPSAGELSNAWGDDHDYFTFVLERSRVVRLETSGPTDTFGVLYDAAGQRLAAADHGAEGRNFGFEAALRPGRYYLRVDGLPGAEGSYELRLSEAE